MASSAGADNLPQDTHKVQHETSVAAVPKRQDFDDEDARDNYHDYDKGYTRNDRTDMGRMGKIQELRVRTARFNLEFD
jgi:hypothetical protein